MKTLPPLLIAVVIIGVLGSLPVALGQTPAGTPTPAATPAGTPTSAATPAGSPEKTVRTLLKVLQDAGQFKTFLKAIELAGLTEKLTQPGPLTIFAPTDDAFASLPAGALDNLLKPENKDKLTQVLLYHMVSGRLTVFELSKDGDDSGEVKTLEGDELDVEAGGGDDKTLQVDDAKVTKADMAAENGVIHVIDRVLQP